MKYGRMPQRSVRRPSASKWRLARGGRAGRGRLRQPTQPRTRDRCGVNRECEKSWPTAQAQAQAQAQARMRWSNATRRGALAVQRGRSAASPADAKPALSSVRRAGRRVGSAAPTAAVRLRLDLGSSAGTVRKYASAFDSHRLSRINLNQPLGKL